MGGKELTYLWMPSLLLVKEAVIDYLSWFEYPLTKLRIGDWGSERTYTTHCKEKLSIALLTKKKRDNLLRQPCPLPRAFHSWKPSPRKRQANSKKPCERLEFFCLPQLRILLQRNLCLYLSQFLIQSFRPISNGTNFHSLFTIWYHSLFSLFVHSFS